MSNGLTGSPVLFSATAAAATPGVATRLTAVSGNGQAGTAGRALTAPFVVSATDANGNGVAGASVTFVITGGGGALSIVQATTDAQGRASTILTLGPAAGINTVTAGCASVAGSSLTFTATASAPTSTAGLIWAKAPRTAGWPASNGYHSIHFDPVSGQTFFYISAAGTTTIYSSDVYFYDAATNIFTHVGGNGSSTNAAGCATVDTPTWPGDRHPVWQMAVDTKRGFLWLYGGVCGGNVRRSTYYMTLNANPMNNRWTLVPTAHFPAGATQAAMAYDPDDDVLFSYGYDGGPAIHNNWAYCRTSENPTPGQLTAKQTAAGCLVPDDWSEVAVAGGVRPSAYNFPGMVYDTVTKKMILYGGGVSTAMNQTWAYDVPKRTWTQKALSTTPPPVSADDVPQPAMAYNTDTHTILYHQTTGAGAPSDWEYNPAADTWTRLTSSGSGATFKQALTYDSKNHMVIGWNEGSSADLWKGTLGAAASPGPSSACDLNNDGVVNNLDVQLAIQQTLGACGNADINGDGLCNVIDVQRIINASLGGACQTGK
jgi:hypothetical protein